MTRRHLFTIFLALLGVLTSGLLPVSWIHSGPSHAEAFSGCETDCLKCHRMSKKEALEILKKMDPKVEILDVKMAPAKGLWEVDFKLKGKKGITYIDFSKQYIIAGEIIRIATRQSLTRKRYIELTKVDFSSIPLEGSLILGSKDAKKKVIVFDDPDCPYCAKLHEQLKDVVEKRKDIAFYIKLFPLKIHKDAYRKAKAIQCRNSIEMLEQAFQKKPIPDPDCKTDVIEENIRLAERLGITGTPTIIFPDGRVISGALRAEDIINYIDRVINKKKNIK